MYSSFLKLCRNRFFTTHKANHIPEPLKLNLIKIFSEEENKKQLCRTLKILPFYFTVELVEQFAKANQYTQYLEYVKQPGESGTDSVYLSQFFSTPWLKKLVTGRLMRRYLEAYLHWLMNECPTFDLHYNNYLIESLNLERPDKWFQIKSYCPQRTFIYHHGPTNSGKSTSAVEELKNLKHDQNGIYMAPLRLLAWEYQQKLGNCSLVTGQEKDYRNSNLVSCTIEAAPLNEEYEVAVIDQIQMIGNSQRGWAWTKAILSVKAKRVHLCGDERALNIITKLLQMTGDVLEERKYSRLSKLILVHKNFKLDSISEGDCFINFSMNSLIEHRNDINKMMIAKQEQQGKEEESSESTPKGNLDEVSSIIKNNHTAIVYGKLPPECRKDQAKRFNQKDLPYLVATNAIGMGLNLNIKKIVFMAIHRSNVQGQKDELQDHEIQQIAGRAGRGKQTGYVQCVNGYILNKVKKALSHVNLSYGLNLQNIAENESEKSEPVVEQVIEDKSSEINSNYNIFLNRHLKQKQCQIQKAGYYYNIDFIAKIRMQIQMNFGINMSFKTTLNFLKDCCIFGNEYFLQQDNYPDYLIQMLEDKYYDNDDMFTFLNGLSLSAAPGSAQKEMKATIKFYHKEYINSFIGERKVRVPQLIVEYDRDHFSKFIYMDQIAELQYYFNLLQTYVWLWSKYQFEFYEINLARQIKIRLARKINQVLLNNQFLPSKKKLVQAEKEENSFTRATEQVQYVRSKKSRQKKALESRKIQQDPENDIYSQFNEVITVKKSLSEKQELRNKYEAIYKKKLHQKCQEGRLCSKKKHSKKDHRRQRQITAKCISFDWENQSKR